MHIQAHAITAFHVFSVIAGSLVVVTAIATYASDRPIGDIAIWMRDFLGLGFIALTLGLSSVVIFSWLTLNNGEPNVQIYVLGLHSANGIATVALTYTLFGISRGIGGLAESNLSPDTVAPIISELTQGFQQAFMTTVVGLPVSALLRAMLQVAGSKALPATQ